MKILRLSFKNLNSLTGVWEIDFKHPDYVSSGIFAITGPTGAGKSTILDAICLALYGQTPRLSRITQGENEIMSRQSGECFAEVEFETAKGRFCCHWSQHRSRRQADGQLQSPRHEISAAETGMILESKLRAVADKVEEVTGMDFDRFTRSMLLAQGGFAAFLQARPDERAPILEQITGTGIYSRISTKVHERTSEERRLLAELQAGLDGILLLSPAEAEVLLAEKSELQRSESILASEAGIIREANSWLERIAVLEGELRQLEQDRLAFETRKAVAVPGLEMLELAARALKLSGGHAHLLSFRMQQEREQGELDDAAERLPQLQIHWQTAFDALEQAESLFVLARTEQGAELELIRKTRELDVKLGEVHTQLQGLMFDVEKIGRQIGGYRLEIVTCGQRMDEIGVGLQEVTAFLDEHQVDEGLAGALAGIEQRLKALKALEKQCWDTRDKCLCHGSTVKDATIVFARAENLWQEGQQAVVSAEEQVALLRAACEAHLQERDLSAWRDEAEALAARMSRVGMLQESVARIKEIMSKLAELKLCGEDLGQKRLELLHREELLSDEYRLREQLAIRLQENVLLLNRVRSLEEDRKQLVDGLPCPLCGSSEHPYAAGNIPQIDEAQKNLNLALIEVQKVREQLSGVRLEQVAVAKDLQRLGQELADFQERQQLDEIFCTNSWIELGITPELDLTDDATAWSEALAGELEACRMALVSRRAVIQEVEQKEREERDAQTALNTLKDELAVLDRARLAARLGEQSALTELTRLEAESAALHSDLERVLAEVRSAVALYGFPELDKADELLAALTSRRDAYVQRLQAREVLERRRTDLVAENDKQRALLAEAEKMLSDKEQQIRDMSARRDALVEQRLEQYGERNPDVEEKRLSETLRLAGESREAALQEQNRFKAELNGLKGQVERLTVSIARRAAQLSDLEAAFSIRLVEEGFADETAFLQACLPQERFDALSDLADALLKEETALHTRQQDRTVELAGELDRKLTDKPLEQISEETAAVTGRLHELQKGLGSVELRLQQHVEQHQHHQARLQAIEIQKGECERWERLHSLIGSGDGKKFRNFAQGLTFELMVAHANRQLQKMSDRYILVRDVDEPLELNVIDNYQAGEIRSTKNLSGGESFIASLALSLGLSSMASRNVRVDSLFLDEGFGTLDEDALETALETLSGLQQDGKLIGIISHVPALKERIGTQIQVEAGSGGRSSISGPGCRRIS